MKLFSKKGVTPMQIIIGMLIAIALLLIGWLLYSMWIDRASELPAIIYNVG